MKGEFYKMEYEAWDEGTDGLSLELEAAYLRLCHQMYRRHGAIPDRPNTLCRIWRCHPNKARKLLSDLIAAGKVRSEGGFLVNDRVTQELHDRETLSRHRADAGKTGGTRSAENRRKSLKNNDTGEAKSAYKRREEEESSTGESAQAREALDADFEEFWASYPNQTAKPKAHEAYLAVRADGVDRALLIEKARHYWRSKPPDQKWLNPASWLSQQRWLDNPAPPPVEPSRHLTVVNGAKAHVQAPVRKRDLSDVLADARAELEEEYALRRAGG